MTGETIQKGRVATIIVAAVGVIGVGLVSFCAGPCTRRGSDAVGSAAEGPEDRRTVSRVRPLGDGGVERPSSPVTGLGSILGRPSRPASGPLRFVARYGEGRPRRRGGEPRTEEVARALAESVRSRVLAGEDPAPLIRSLSDPPIGLAPDLVARHAELQPGQASPVEPIESGFALFFGNPYRPPPSEGASE